MKPHEKKYRHSAKGIATRKRWEEKNKPSLKTAQAKYSSSKIGKATKKAWRGANGEKIRKWKREWARSSNGRASSRKWYKKSPKAMFSLYRKGAKRRSLPFKITVEYFLEMVVQPCIYCGSIPPADSGRNGLDRVDNDKGYTKKNTVTCCYLCNQMKSNRTRQLFLEHTRQIAKYSKEL